jgi:hypothetical protein
MGRDDSVKMRTAHGEELVRGGGGDRKLRQMHLFTQAPQLGAGFTTMC